MPTDRERAEVNIDGLLQDWGRRWGLPHLGQCVQVQWGGRLLRSLGRVYLDRRVVRLSRKLERAPITVLREVLCHEVAHIAVRDLHGRDCQPHGPQWAALVQAAGFEPRRRIPWPAASSLTLGTTPRRR